MNTAPTCVGLALLAGLSSAACGVSVHEHMASRSNSDAGPPPVPVLGMTDASTTATDGDALETDLSPDDSTIARDAASEPIVLSGITVNINGVEVPKEHVIAFLHFGHSNMSGRAWRPDTTRPYFFETSPNAWMYHVGQKWELAVEPNTAGDVGNVNGTIIYGGPGTAIVKEAASLAPGNIFVSLGFGASAAQCHMFLPGELYYDSMIAAAKELKGKVTFAAIVTMLAINERSAEDLDPNTGTADCFAQLAADIRRDLDEPNLPLLVSDYEMGATGAYLPSLAINQTIIANIHRVPGLVANSALIPTDGIEMEDEHHFDLDGHKDWSGRLLQIMRDKGWFPWAP